MKALLTRAVLVLALAVPASTGALAASPPAGAASAPAIVRHAGPSWVWFGPRAWDAAYGTYGITVLGNAGATLDLGFSSILCSAGATWNDSVTTYFAAQRRQLRTAGWRFEAGRIVRPAGFSSMYRRQVLNGTNNRGGRRQGQIVLDYDFTTNVDGLNYCYQRSIAKYARPKAWRTTLRQTLTRVQQSLAYSGPGAPEGQDPDA